MFFCLDLCHLESLGGIYKKLKIYFYTKTPMFKN